MYEPRYRGLNTAPQVSGMGFISAVIGGATSIIGALTPAPRGDFQKFARTMQPYATSNAQLTGIPSLVYWFSDFLRVEPSGNFQIAITKAESTKLWDAGVAMDDIVDYYAAAVEPVYVPYADVTPPNPSSLSIFTKMALNIKDVPLDPTDPEYIAFFNKRVDLVNEPQKAKWRYVGPSPDGLFYHSDGTIGEYTGPGNTLEGVALPSIFGKVELNRQMAAQAVENSQAEVMQAGFISGETSNSLLTIAGLGIMGLLLFTASKTNWKG